MARIYISSTYSDLRDYRERVCRGLRQMGHHVIAMEDYVATDQRPVDKCLSDLATCDVYIGIFARRYGYVPASRNPEASSITEIEFRKAQSSAIQCLLFLLDEAAEWPVSHVESGKGQHRLRSLREEVCANFTVSFFRSPDDLTALVSAAVAKWERDSPPASVEALEKLLDVLAIRRAFFKGDDRLYQDAMAVTHKSEHLWKMLGYLDAGRAVVVARSFAEAANELREPLSSLTGTLRRRIGQEVAHLIVVCKDYAERYGRRRDEGNLPLPHIGWGQRLGDFTGVPEQFGFSSLNSFEVYEQLLHYFARSCSDLAEVRNCAQRLLCLIAATEPSLAGRAETIGSDVEEGTRQLDAMRDKLERAAAIIRDVLGNVAGFDERRSMLRQRASSEAPEVSSLLLAIANVRSALAWSTPSPETTLTAAVYLDGFRLRVSFDDGLSEELELGKEYWEEIGIAMDINVFKSFQLDTKVNAIVWSRHQFLVGHDARHMITYRSRKPKANG